MRFRNSNTTAQLKLGIQSLFDDARKEWPGVFAEDERIKLTPDHLSVCVGGLEEWKLFNSNLDVVDEAYEYLVSKSSKGEKGQYFTPRWVIDMCVKMMNPKATETVIDTACGSAGFTVHTIFHVWRQILDEQGLQSSNLFTMEEKPQACKDYVRDKVFAIDFDEKSVRVARCLNLIAGDGQTNVLHLNTLDYTRWDETAKELDWQDTYGEGWKKLRKLQTEKQSHRNFCFDVLLANPPFAGDIKQSDMLSPYDLGHKTNGKLETAVGRDLLFIERNLDFLRPGGRMAVVLPQGRFNNSSDKRVREFIAERCRILAVVGLHANTFKPHTGTKTSVLFVQKWNDDATLGPLCKKKDDYNIFFATQQLPSKDNSGDKILVLKDGKALRDEHGHTVVQHDLFNHDGLTTDGIAEAFELFAAKEKLGFFLKRPFDEARYRVLLEGLEVAVVNTKDVATDNPTGRFDAEYFRKEFLSSLPGGTYLGELALIRSGTTPADREDDLESGICLLKTTDVRNRVLSAPDAVNYYKISPEIAYRMKATKLEAGDVLLNIVGATTNVLGRTALVPNDFPEANITQAMTLIRLPESTLRPQVLFAYLLGKFGHDGERLLVAGNEPDSNPVVQARAQAAWLRTQLRESTGKDFEVWPVIVFPGWFVEATSTSQRKLWVLEPKALPTFLKNEPVSLSAEDRKLASFHLSRMIRAAES